VKAPSCRAHSGSSRHSPPPARPKEAAELFEQLLELASPAGLYGEEMDPSTHAHLGNYPQALTHAALVQAALALRDTQPPAGGRGAA
jgi:GH15 family glucan-1,4-alpha-glucosidase